MLEYIVEVMRILEALRLDMNLWKAQNIYFALGRKYYRQKSLLATTDEYAARWVKAFDALGNVLKVKVT